MRIVADKHIPYVTEAFSNLGDLSLVDGRVLASESLVDADILLVRSVTHVTEELIKDAKKLKFVASPTSGREHIDLPYLEKRGIAFAYAPGSNADSVAQYVVAAVLHMAGSDKLRKSTLGIIGVGHIGSLVDAYAVTLGMNCLLNDPPKRRSTHDERYRTLDEVLEASDIVTLHVPLERQGSDPTYRMVNDGFMARMKSGSFLINTSRGKVADETSLKKYRSKLGGLVLDVWDSEPAIDPELCRLASIATPHIAGYSLDGKIKGTLMLHQALCSFLKRDAFWNPEALLSESAGTIDSTISQDPILCAVKCAYPIMRDDCALRQIVSLDIDGRAGCFDALRAKYPRRFEFDHYRVACLKSQNKKAEILRKMKFTVNVG
jgi:erythronate-4-phosphate dehydrogenase